jgi:putative ABC transport system permease protein
MNRTLLIRSVLARLRRYKMKTLAMALGIVVGVLSTVLLQTVADSVYGVFIKFIERAYPSDAIVLTGGTGFMGAGPGRDKLQLADIEAIASSTGSNLWDPVIYLGSRDVKRGGNNLRVSIAGYSERAESVRRRSVADGELFDETDVRNRARVAIIGPTTAATLFEGESPLGADLFIDNIAFQVKGVLEPLGVDPHGNDQDNTIWLPYTTVMDSMLKRTTVNGATFIVPAERQASVEKEITDIMRERHQIGAGQEDDFTVITPVFMRQLFDRSFRIFTIFVPLISGTVFVISAVVILSIMQISIKGRVREIGLRKAVGARPRDLQTQIVLEVLLISAGASLAGIVLALLGCIGLAPLLAAKFGIREATPSALVLIVAVVAATATGLAGGLLPARRAARLDPVDALR